MTIRFQRTTLVTLLAASLVSLGGCIPLVPLMVGGAVVGGGMVATDRRTSGTVLEDETIEIKAASRIRENIGDRVHVNVTSYNRQVLLTGEVPSAQDKQLVEKIVAGVENARNIVNELAVMGNSTLTQRSSDSLVSTRVKAALVDDKDLYANAYKIVTERGTVYVQGRVTKREADRGTEVIRNVQGVQRLVRIFEIISEDELKRLLPQPAPASAAPPPERPLMKN
jgi:osmotically-inducible protein OsmY